MSLEVFRKFPTIEDSKYLTEILDENKIPYKIEDYSKQADMSFMGQNTDLKVILKVRVSDFPKIDKLLEEKYDIKLDQVDKEHYLFEFSDDELTEIIIKPDEWNEFDVKVATLILNDRGVQISQKLIDNIKLQRTKEKESYPGMWIVIGYISAFLGGVLGIAIGLSLSLMRKTLPNGDKVYIYDENNRTHGKRITVIGIIMIIIILGIRVYLINQ